MRYSIRITFIQNLVLVTRKTQNFILKVKLLLFTQAVVLQLSRLREYSCFEKRPKKPYTTMPKGIMGNGGSWSLIEALGVSTTWSETAKQIYLCLSLSLLVNNVNLN